MLYILFFILATLYNLRKFNREKAALFASLIEAQTLSHREMILSHNFYIYIFEGFLAIVVASIISEKNLEIGILGLGLIYIILLFVGYFIYQYLIRYIEKQTGLVLFAPFRQHLIRELRVNFAIILLPIFIYSLFNLTFQDAPDSGAGGFWFLSLLFNIIFISVLTIACSVIIMLRLIPNREITEPEYLNIINHRLEQIQMPNMRVRWIEADIKNAFVVGLKLLKFSNQTMFIGKNLRTMLTLEEFDAVVAHELSHVANRHIHKRMIDLLKYILVILLGSGLLMLTIFTLSTIYWGEDAEFHLMAIVNVSLGLCSLWFLFSYASLFDTIRSHEFEADAYAVINMGVSFEALKSALRKLVQTNDLPEYLRSKRKNIEEIKGIRGWIYRVFSTHPDLDTRISSLQNKIQNNLPFNFYISPVQKLRKSLSILVNWRVSVPLTVLLLGVISWNTWIYFEKQKLISFIYQAPYEEIIQNKELVKNINELPPFMGRSLMFHIVQRKDEKLIDFFLVHGADKSKTLYYIALSKDLSLFQKYYSLYQGALNEDEYFFVLRKTAQMNFTEGYRFLVNSERFEHLTSRDKDSLIQIHKMSERNRLPASEKDKK